MANQLEMMQAPPSDIEAEMSTLGCLMMDAENAMPVVSAILTESDFYRPSHGVIFSAMRTVYESNEPVDIISLSDELRRRGMLDEVGGAEYLMALNAQVPSIKRADTYARIVKDKSHLRALIKAGSEIAAIAREGLKAEDAIAKASEVLLKATECDTGGFIPISEAASRAFEQIDQYIATKGELRGPCTGLAKIDRLTMGLDPELTLVAGGTGLGKTSFLLQIARESSHLSGAFFELEMGAEQLAERMIASRARVDSYSMRSGLMSDDDLVRIARAVNELCKMNLYIYDQPVNVTRMMALAQQAIIKHKVDYILVDYLGLIEPPKGKKQESRNLELGSIVRGLQNLARLNKVPVIAACQLSRRWQDRENKRPTLRDLRDSGELEQHAYRVILLHDPNPPDAWVNNDKLPIEVELAKHRGGPIGLQKVWLERKTFTFTNMDEMHDE